jgi:ABC-type transport system involved in multi-copper enzyme maturation permease subunit
MWHEPNPVLVKELRGRMRGPRAFVVLTVYLLLLSCLVSVVYLSMTLQGNSYGNYSANLDNVGRAVFVTAALSQAVLITFIAPAFTAGAITGERERKTYETLRSTLLPAHHILLGKLTVALTYLGLLLLAAVPLNGLALMLGGVSLDQVLRVLLILAQSIFSISMLGLFFSSLLRSTLASTVATYATILVLALVLPALVVLVVEAMPYISRWFENVMQFVSYTVASASPVGATLLTTTGEDVWLFSLTSTLTVPAPWLMYLIIHPGGSLVLFALALWRLQSQEIR